MLEDDLVPASVALWGSVKRPCQESPQTQKNLALCEVFKSLLCVVEREGEWCTRRDSNPKPSDP